MSLQDICPFESLEEYVAKGTVRILCSVSEMAIQRWEEPADEMQFREDEPYLLASVVSRNKTT